MILTEKGILPDTGVHYNNLCQERMPDVSFYHLSAAPGYPICRVAPGVDGGVTAAGCPTGSTDREFSPGSHYSRRRPCLRDGGKNDFTGDGPDHRGVGLQPPRNPRPESGSPSGPLRPRCLSASRAFATPRRLCHVVWYRVLVAH